MEAAFWCIICLAKIAAGKYINYENKRFKYKRR